MSNDEGAGLPEGAEPTRHDDRCEDAGEELDLASLMDKVHAEPADEDSRLYPEFEDRPLIDQATGLLMAVHECAAGAALGLLTRLAREHNMTPGDLAAGLAGLAAARGGRSSLNLSPAMKAAVRAVLSPAGRSPAGAAGPAPSSMPGTTS
jgi:hypothetical protein